ncbi:MAG: hypothetical protein M3O84_08600 [Actinomycetota bacterium]|nr:hypothetical protein [Actinomycetota bacterium]
MTVLLVSTVVGYNIDRIRSFVARKREEASAKRPRAKRRTGTWDDLLSTPESSTARPPDDPAPPPT